MLTYQVAPTERRQRSGRSSRLAVSAWFVDAGRMAPRTTSTLLALTMDECEERCPACSAATVAATATRESALRRAGIHSDSTSGNARSEGKPHVLLAGKAKAGEAESQRDHLPPRRRIGVRRARADDDRQRHARIGKEKRGELSVERVHPERDDGIADDEREHDGVCEREARAAAQYDAERERNRNQREAFDRPHDAQIELVARAHERRDRRDKQELAAPVAILRVARVAHVGRDRRLGMRAQARLRRHVRPQADARRCAPHVELIGVAQHRRGADDGVHTQRAEHDQREREQGANRIRTGMMAWGRCEAAGIDRARDRAVHAQRPSPAGRGRGVTGRDRLEFRARQLRLLWLARMRHAPAQGFRKAKSTPGLRPETRSATALPDPQLMVHPSVPWPVFRYRFA